MLTMFEALGAGLAVLVLLAVAAMAIAPRFLDRIYYRGPVSDHFDGERFFNPGDPPRGANRGFSFFRFLRFAFGMDRTPWPKSVSVERTVPPSRVEGQDMRVTWIGHATVLVQTQGLNILTDPVWSTRASPFGFMGPKRVTEPGVAFDDLPKIDLVLLSHNHYDHLDLATLERLWKRDRPLIVTPLGNDTILRSRRIESVTRDWGGRVPVRPGIDVIVERAHHWGSRWGADRNRALWGGLTVTLPGGNLFFAGDTGWGDGSWTLGIAANGPHRFALIPIGAYLPRELMRASHVGPDEAVAIFRAIDPRHALGIHWGTFQLSEEGYATPAEMLAEEATAAGIEPGRFRTIAPGETWLVPAI